MKPVCLIVMAVRRRLIAGLAAPPGLSFLLERTREVRRNMLAEWSFVVARDLAGPECLRAGIPDR
jgi:hypothetical protein